MTKNLFNTGVFKYHMRFLDKKNSEIKQCLRSREKNKISKSNNVQNNHMWFFPTSKIYDSNYVKKNHMWYFPTSKIYDSKYVQNNHMWYFPTKKSFDSNYVRNNHMWFYWTSKIYDSNYVRNNHMWFFPTNKSIKTTSRMKVLNKISVCIDKYSQWTISLRQQIDLIHIVNFHFGQFSIRMTSVVRDD